MFIGGSGCCRAARRVHGWHHGEKSTLSVRVASQRRINMVAGPVAAPTVGICSESSMCSMGRKGSGGHYQASEPEGKSSQRCFPSRNLPTGGRGATSACSCYVGLNNAA